VITAAAFAAWAAHVAVEVSRTLEFARQRNIDDATIREAHRTTTVVVLVTTAVWAVAVWAWTWRRGRSSRPVRSGRYVGLFIVLAAVLFSVTPFTSERFLECPGPVQSKITQWRHLEWEYICGYNSNPYLATAAVGIVVGLVVLRRSGRARPPRSADSSISDARDA
jgi:hypothetical protein